MFDFIVGNPPYQEDQVGSRRLTKNIYTQFMTSASILASCACLVTPARWLFRAGSESKAWYDEVLNSPHWKILKYEPNSQKIFQNVDIRGGYPYPCLTH